MIERLVGSAYLYYVGRWFSISYLLIRHDNERIIEKERWYTW